MEAEGFSVWWDRTIQPGSTYDREIENAIADARCMVVVWTADSVESEYLRSEVEERARRDMLTPVLFDNVLPPLAHRRLQAANLVDWEADVSAEYSILLDGIHSSLQMPRTAA